MHTHQNYGKELRARRKAHNLTQEQLGRMAGVTGSTVSAHEKRSKLSAHGKFYRSYRSIMNALEKCDHPKQIIDIVRPTSSPEPFQPQKSSKLDNPFVDALLKGGSYTLGVIITLAFVFFITKLLV